jgi:glycosyltransferase involved in cell wall biosynthesis
MTDAAPMPIRILLVSNLFPPHVMGGAELVAFRQARRLQARGHSVSVLAGRMACSGAAGGLSVSDEDGIRVWRTQLASFSADEGFFVSAINEQFPFVLEAERPDLVHAHNLNGLGYPLIALARGQGLPIVVTLHDHGGYCHRGTALRPDDSLCREPQECALACQNVIQPRSMSGSLPLRLRRDYVAWALGQADRLIAPSRNLARAYVAAGVAEAGQVEIISNGIDLEPFHRVARRNETVLSFTCIAFLGEHKGILDLLHAAALLAKDRELVGRWSLTIAGDGHLRPEVEAQIASGRFGGAVTYLGRIGRDRVVSELASTDVVILPSRWPENEPVVLLEAIAAGAAQLATYIGGIPDLVQQGVTGELIPPADPEALARAMADYVRTPDRARRQGEANFARRERFSDEAAIIATERAFETARRSRRPWMAGSPLVLCGGGAETQAVAICSHLYRLEQPCSDARLVWHDWVSPQDWEEAVLVWHWDSRPDVRLIQRALGLGLPIVAPAGSTAATEIERRNGVALTYSTPLECLLMLARLPHDRVSLRALSRGDGGSLRQRFRDEAKVLLDLRLGFALDVNGSGCADA